MYARTRMPSSQRETRRRQACGQPRGCPAAVTEDGDFHHGGVREVSSVVCVLRRQRARSFGRVVALYSRRSRRGDFLVGTSQEARSLQGLNFKPSEGLPTWALKIDHHYHYGYPLSSFLSSRSSQYTADRRAATTTPLLEQAAIQIPQQQGFVHFCPSTGRAHDRRSFVRLSGLGR